MKATIVLSFLIVFILHSVNGVKKSSLMADNEGTFYQYQTSFHEVITHLSLNVLDYKQFFDLQNVWMHLPHAKSISNIVVGIPT